MMNTTRIARRRRFFAFSFVALAGLSAMACGGDDGAPAPGVPLSGDTGGVTAPGETPSPSPGGASPAPVGEGPNVVSTLPANGAKGVKADASLVVKFDRAMDAQSVEAAYSSVDLPSEMVALSWNAAADELTIKPVSPLSYAEGSAEVAAKTYAIAIGTAAKDKAGLALSKEHVTTFATLRRVGQKMKMEIPMTGRVLSNHSFSSYSLAAGDMLSDGEREARALFTFFVTDLPEGSGEIESVNLKVPLMGYSGTPDESLGALTAEQVFYSAGSEGFAAEPVSGTSTTLDTSGAVAFRAVDVTTMFKDDLANRVARSDRTQYRLRYLTPKNDDGAADLAVYNKTGVSLTVTYLAE